MNMWQEIPWQPELGNYKLRWLEVKKKFNTSENVVHNLQVDVIIMRASLTEVHLESLKTAHYISRVYNGIVKEQKNILLEICFSWAHFNGKQAQQMAKPHIHSRILPSEYKRQMENNVFFNVLHNRGFSFWISKSETLLKRGSSTLSWDQSFIQGPLLWRKISSLKNIWFYGRFLRASNYL